jgi:hypothetical protein
MTKSSIGSSTVVVEVSMVVMAGSPCQEIQPTPRAQRAVWDGLTFLAARRYGARRKCRYRAPQRHFRGHLRRVSGHSAQRGQSGSASSVELASRLTQRGEPQRCASNAVRS